MRNDNYFLYWKQVADVMIQNGIGLSFADMYAIVDNLDFGNMKTEYLPSSTLAEKSNPKRRNIQFEYLKKLYLCEPETWLENEKTWLQSQRDRVGLTIEDGKDGLDDVISTAIISQIIVSAYLLFQIKKGEYGSNPISNAKLERLTLRSLNQVIENAVLKGFARGLRLDTTKSKDTGYSLLLSAGVRVGVTGKYLPDPENTLWKLLVLLHKDSIDPNAYNK